MIRRMLGAIAALLLLGAAQCPHLAPPTPASAAGLYRSLYSWHPQVADVANSNTPSIAYTALYYQTFPAAHPEQITDSDAGLVLTYTPGTGQPWVSTLNPVTKTSALPTLTGPGNWYIQFRARGSSNAADVLQAQWLSVVEHATVAGGPAITGGVTFPEVDVNESHFASPASKQTVIDWFGALPYSKGNYDDLGQRPAIDFTQWHTYAVLCDYTAQAFTFYVDDQLAYTKSWVGLNFAPFMATYHFYPIIDLTSSAAPAGTASTLTVSEVSVWH